MQSGNLAAQLVAAALLAPSACHAQDTAATNTVTVTLHASVNSLGVFQAEADVAATGAWSAPYREASSHRPADLLSPELFGGFLTKGHLDAPPAVLDADHSGPPLHDCLRGRSRSSRTIPTPGTTWGAL